MRGVALHTPRNRFGNREIGRAGDLDVVTIALDHDDLRSVPLAEGGIVGVRPSLPAGTLVGRLYLAERKSLWCLGLPDPRPRQRGTAAT